MPEFSYRGRNGEGLLVEGRVNASSVTLAAKQLQQDGLLVLNLQEEKAQRQSGNSIELFKPRIQTEEIILLSRQLMALSRAGVPIIRALNGLAESSANSEVKRVLQDISQTLIGGADLTSAFSRHPKVFSPIYLNMIHIGETTGKITEALAALVDHLERERDTRRKMKGALRYPIMVIGAISVALSVIALYVIPSFQQVFASLGTDLPLATRILLGVSSFATEYGSFLGASLVLTVIGFWHYQRSAEGGRNWDLWLLKIPLLGSILERLSLARFARSLSIMMAAGVPILRCLNVVSDSVGNRHIAAEIRQIQNSVERGVSLTQAAVASGLFTPLVLQMLAVGEETGSVDTLMKDVADFYDEEVDYELKHLAEAIEPIMLIFMGVLVLILALGVFLPIWELGSAAQKGVG